MTTNAADALDLAVQFHETYERLAPSFGYETRSDTKAFDSESANGRLMIAVCGEILEGISGRHHQSPCTVERPCIPCYSDNGPCKYSSLAERQGEAVAFEHGLTVEGQRMPILSYDESHPFGEFGVSHSGEVDCRPLYAHPAPAAVDDAMVERFQREYRKNFIDGKNRKVPERLRAALTAALQNGDA